MDKFSRNTALLLIDVQQAFDDSDYWGKRNNPDAELNMAALLACFRKKGWSVLHAQHVSAKPTSLFHPDKASCAFKDEVQPQGDEPVFQKNTNSAFIGTDLESYLQVEGITVLVIAGLITDHCVSTTVRMAANLGFDVVLADDATATFDRLHVDGDKFYDAQMIHDIHLASLHGEFCRVMPTHSIIRIVEE